MTAERFEQVDQILQAALDRDRSERDAFIDEACGGDTALRSKVVALISSDEEAGSFIETPAFEVAARMIAAEQSEVVEGQAVGPYQITSLLGSGGMGDVFLAHDNRLNRKVALKLLPDYFTRDEERLKRFHQEARAVSALNHPNIITIFEIGKAESIHFIATEYITGETLRKRMSLRTMTLSETIEIAIQIAGALASAHLAGIVHRDIKPENIMLRDDGYVKVLDFGLAKLAESQVTEAKAPKGLKVETNPGVVMGTASYMSPEQARGHEVDRRSDIFSLGVVVYEMVAGRQPFEAETTSDVIAAILKQEPAPLARYSREVPEGLEWIVAKMLVKDREERYQTATEMLFDLKKLKQRLDYEAQQQRWLSPSLEAGGVTTNSESIVTKSDSEQIIDTATLLTRKSSSAEYLISEIKRHKPGVFIALSIFIIAAVGVGVGLYKLLRQNKPSVPFQTGNSSNLTTTGHITHAAISPDGKYVAHVVEDQGKQSLWVRQVATTSRQQVVGPADANYLGLVFSTDGNSIYYTVRESDKPLEGALYQVPVLAGTPPRKLLTNIDSTITVSPDGKRLAYGVVNTIAKESALMIANIDGTGAYALVTKNGPQFGDFQWRFSNPAWSPDGKVIAYGGRIKQQPGDREGRRGSVIEVNVKDGSEKPITDHTWLQAGRLAWLHDGRGLIITAAERFGLFQLWHLSYPGGEARRITNDESKDYRGVSLTTDASLLATTQRDEQSSIWIAPDGDTSRAQRITPGRYEGRYGVAWTADARIVYHSFASGNEDIWIMNSDGSGQSPLTVNPGADDDCCEVSPDGRYIVFRSQRGDGTALWRMDSDGGNAKRLTSEGNQPTVSPDGRWVIYHKLGALWKVSIDGGEAAQLNTTSGGGYGNPAISPDGKLIACEYRDDPNAGPRLAIIPSEGGPPIKLFDTLPVMLRPLRGLQWTPDGKAIAYLKTTGGVSNIWSQSLDGKPAKPLTDFKSGSMFSFGWSRDGKQLVYARGAVTSDVVLIRDSK